MASVVPGAARGRARERQRGPGRSKPFAGLDRVPPTEGHRNRARKQLRDLHQPRGSRRRAARSGAPGPVRHATTPARQTREVGTTQLLPLGTARVLRNYSLSGQPGADYYRITVKREQHGAASGYLHTRIAVGDQLEIAAPRGTFILDQTDAPVLLISAGIGATPVLSMLHALATEHSDRVIWWLHGARSSRDHSFAAEARALLASLPNGRTHVCYSRPRPDDLEGRDFDTASRLTGSLLAELGPPRNAEAYLCGPTPFMEEISAGLAAIGLGGTDIHTEPFGPAPGFTPGIAATPTRTPHPPARERGAGPMIEFARSNLAVPCSDDYASLLELAEACDVPVRWSCRTGVCHNCETTLIAGTIDYNPDPVEPPADGSALICCSQPHDDVVLDCDRQPPGQGPLISLQARISGAGVESGSTTRSRPSEALGAGALRPAPDLPSSSHAYLVAGVGRPALRGSRARVRPRASRSPANDRVDRTLPVAPPGFRSVARPSRKGLGIWVVDEPTFGPIGAVSGPVGPAGARRGRSGPCCGYLVAVGPRSSEHASRDRAVAGAKTSSRSATSRWSWPTPTTISSPRSAATSARTRTAPA